MTTGPTSPSASSRLAQWPIVAACGLVLASIAVVAAVRLSGLPIGVADAPVVEARALRFIDRPDGSISVVDAADDRLVESIVGERGFVRGTLRGLARERRRQGIGAEQPFRLVAHSDGRLTLMDPATGRRVDLESFGPSNESEFARMLEAPSKTAAVSRPGA
jgi:putative photosynthetic complex assembly protein